MKTKLFKIAFICFLMVLNIKKHHAQSTVTGKPPDYGQIALRISDCGSNRPKNRVFTIEAAFVWNGATGPQPILGSEDGHLALYLLDGNLKWSYKNWKNPSLTTEEFATIDGRIKKGARHLVRLVHGAKDRAFFIDETEAETQFEGSPDPSEIRVDGGNWLAGLSQNGHFFDGYLQNVRLYDGDLREMDRIKDPQKRESTAREKLIFDFWLDDFSPRKGDEKSQVIDSRAQGDEPCGFASIILEPNVKLLPEKSEKPGWLEPPKDEKELKRDRFFAALVMAIAVVGMMVLIVWLTSLTGSKNLQNVSMGRDLKVLNAELPPALAGVGEREEVFFIIRNRLPIPWTQLVFICGVACAAFFGFQTHWLEVLRKTFSDDQVEQTRGVMQLLFSLGGLAAFLAFLLWKDGYEVRTLLNGRSYYIGLADRLLVVEPTRGLFRPIFWEQIREAERTSEGANIRLTLRTLMFPAELEIQEPERLILNGFERRANLVERHILDRMAAAPIPKKGPDEHINFGSPESSHYPKADFIDLVAYDHLVFVPKSPFGARPFLMLRSRIEKVEIEPFDDQKKSGWLLVARLKKGLRQPLAVIAELELARSAAHFLNREK